MTGNVITFGKHKGKSVEEVREVDPGYLEWLILQPWFREKFVNIYQVVVNRAPGEHQDSPEHNNLQVRFQDHDFCLNICRNLKIVRMEIDQANHYRVADAKYNRTSVRPFVVEDDLMVDSVDFEVGRTQIDVVVHMKDRKSVEYQWFSIGFELKPQVGDDYPAVLRQMRKNGAQVLVLQSYHGVGATREQFVRTFEMAGFEVVFVSPL